MTAREPITVSVKAFCVLSGLCRDKVFELIRNGTLDSFKCGKLRLISVDSYRRWVAEQISLDRSHRVVPYRRSQGR
jgi:hypothetical protein